MAQGNERIQVIQSGDVEISFRIFGSPGAMPMLIVHGLSYFSYDWRAIANRLAVDRQVVAMDMRGFGDSSWSRSKAYDLEAMSADPLAVARHLGWRRWIALGHSMGGRLSTFYAARHSECVDKLILVDYSPDTAKAGGARVTETVAKQPDVFTSIESAMEYSGIDPFSERGVAMRPRYEAYLRMVPGGFQVKRDLYFRDQFKRRLETGEKPKLGVDMWDLLAEVKCETLVVRGAKSDMFAAETVPKMLHCNPRLHVREVEGGHDVPGEAPDSLVEYVQAFISGSGINRGKLRVGPMRGIDHLALVTDDLPATLDFYTRVLGLQLVHARRVPFEEDRGQPPYDNVRHYFFNMGNDSLLAFFEYPKGLARQSRDLPGGMQHLAFSVAPDSMDSLVAHIKSCGVDVIGPVSLGGRFLSAYFYDNNGVRLELCTTSDAEQLEVVSSVLQSRAEARAELTTLFNDAVEVDQWLEQMPLKD